MSTGIYVSDRHARWRRRRIRRHGRVGRLLRAGARWGLLLASLLVALGLALGAQLFSEPAPAWLKAAGSGPAYALVWCFGLALLRPSARPALVAALAACICFAVEVSQLWHPHTLEVWRATELGRLAVGSGFAWLDLVGYATGALLGGLWLCILPFRRRRITRFERPLGVVTRA